MTRPALDILREELTGGRTREVWVRFPRQLGDVIFSLPFFGCLQRSWNAIAEDCGGQLQWVAVGHAIGAALFSEANPRFVARSVIEGGGRQKPDPWTLVRQWRAEPPVAVINLSQSVRLALAAWIAKVPIRAGDDDNHLGLLYHHRFTYRDLPMHVAQRFGALLHQLTDGVGLAWVPLSPDQLGGLSGLEKLQAAGWKGEPYITLAVGTRGLAKRWFPEAEKWPALARILQQRGFTPVWLGSADECPLVNQLAAAVPGSLDLSGRTTLPEACAIQFRAAGQVSIDTGLAHTAAAMGIPVVTLIGASTEALINPLGPYAISLRGPALDLAPGQAAYETHGSEAHRIAPERVAELLGVLMRERQGRIA